MCEYDDAQKVGTNHIESYNFVPGRALCSVTRLISQGVSTVLQLLNKGIECSHIEPKCTTNFHVRDLSFAPFLVNRVHFQSEIVCGLADVQEPFANAVV